MLTCSESASRVKIAGRLEKAIIVAVIHRPRCSASWSHTMRIPNGLIKTAFRASQ